MLLKRASLCRLILKVATSPLLHLPVAMKMLLIVVFILLEWAAAQKKDRNCIPENPLVPIPDCTVSIQFCYRIDRCRETYSSRNNVSSATTKSWMVHAQIASILFVTLISCLCTSNYTARVSSMRVPAWMTGKVCFYPTLFQGSVHTDR